jgi:hypothetical protein
MPKALAIVSMFVIAAVWAAAQAPDPPLQDTRLTVHTLVREDVFAGFLRNDLQRLTRAERNLTALLTGRPAERPSVLAWQGSTAMTRALVAFDANDTARFRDEYDRAQRLWAEAMAQGPDVVGVWAIVGGTRAMLSERLPLAERRASWDQAYAAYQRLWQMQSGIIDKLPLHHKGEVLAGLAESAQFTGRTDEVTPHLDRIVSTMAGTPYATRAQQWKDAPAARTQTRLTCQTCHGPGTLTARMAEVAAR